MTLKGAPYNLPWGSSVFASVFASNIYGDGTTGTGNGAKILTNPDAPLNLALDLTKMTPTAIGLTWALGVANGGAAVTEYRLSYD